MAHFVLKVAPAVLSAFAGALRKMIVASAATATVILAIRQFVFRIIGSLLRYRPRIPARPAAVLLKDPNYYSSAVQFHLGHLLAKPESAPPPNLACLSITIPSAHGLQAAGCTGTAQRPTSR